MGLVSAGVVLATLSRPAPAGEAPPRAAAYAAGIAILCAGLVLSGTLGLLQERTYTRYGAHWREGLFYTVRPAPSA